MSKEKTHETMSLAAFYSANSKTNLDFAREFVLIGNGSGRKVWHTMRADVVKPNSTDTKLRAGESLDWFVRPERELCRSARVAF